MHLVVHVDIPTFEWTELPKSAEVGYADQARLVGNKFRMI